MSDGGSFPLRYVVLRHEGIEQPHFDLLFETEIGSELEAYRIDRWPVDESTIPTPNRLHRRIYLDYEGEISHGRGHVTRVAAGCCALIETVEGSTLRFDDSTLRSVDLETRFKQGR